MSSSLRVSDALFASAATAGKMLSRSTAQQVEHWARLGKALEAAGLSAEAAMQLFRTTESADAMWTHKRALQQRDIALVKSGRAKQADMMLFTPAMARKAKVLNGPY